MNVPHESLFQYCTNGSAPPNRRAARAPDKKYLKMTSPEPLVQIQNNFTELFLIMPFTKIAQMVLLCLTKRLPEIKIRNIFKRHLLLNHWSKFKIIYTEMFLMMPSTKIAQMVPLHRTKGLPEL